ncbi:MAG: hypothetical protein PHT53_01075 [Candidatus Omnitrophica bacterium]|nr:hypothetical protein [Candidatus Omnitrophota bacterium]
MIKTVIILGNHVQSLGVMQSAGKMGLETTLFNKSKLCIAAFSKYCSNFILYKDANELKEKLLNLYKGTKNAVIIPTNDYLVEFVATNYDILRKYYYLAIPESGVAGVCLNKILTYQKAREFNIPILKFSIPNNLTEALNAAEQTGYPVVLRPAFMHKFFPGTGKKILLCRDKNSLIENYKFMSGKIPAEEVIVQEYVPKKQRRLFSFCSFSAGGNIYGGFTLHRTRQRPGEFGISTFAKTVNIEEIEKMSMSFLKKINYFGISEIEFIYDEKSGQYSLIEINPRMWKQNSIAEKLGINLVKMLIDCLGGKQLSVNINRKSDIAWIEPITDFFAAIDGLRKREINIKQYINSLRMEKKIAVFSMCDPMPGIMYILLLPYLFRERR